MWGILYRGSPGRWRRRFTPTRVGNTLLDLDDPAGQYRFTPTRVGNTTYEMLLDSVQNGSPPRVWGILSDIRANSARWRFTPTRVGNTEPGPATRPAREVHPHACGEYEAAGLRPNTLKRFTPTRVGNTPPLRRPRRLVHGSPPRVWGILGQEVGAGQAERFTPTRVGNTMKVDVSRPQVSVHPHACGEYSPKKRDCWGHSGSPPRVWGIRARPAQRTRPGRFTPTRVGNTPARGSAWRPGKVHPHACGEYLGGTYLVGPQLRFTPTRVGNTGSGNRPDGITNGSPPRVWGIRAARRANATAIRFTPTRVGNTPGRPTAYRVAVRFTPTRVGNTGVGYAEPTATGGSPPRVWGILHNLWPPFCPRPVHPHACGEYLACVSSKTRPNRFTPTRVGNTHQLAGHTAPHSGSPPRVWGIRVDSRPLQVPACGSPPRVWGIRAPPDGLGGESRFTPTRVGNTGRQPAIAWRPRFTPTRVGNTPRRDNCGTRPAVHPHACGEYAVP